MAFRKMLLASAAVACAALPITAHADTSAKKIALSNNYAGNS
nr:sugar ABC transporter substrate-binding protein [Rhizobium sp. P007]